MKRCVTTVKHAQAIRADESKADDSVFVDNADPDALRLDDLDSNASLDEDAVPMRKVTANNKVSPDSHLAAR